MSSFVPERNVFLDLARRGELAFVYKSLVADDLTPVSAYARLGRRPYSFLLESIQGTHRWATHSYLGVGENLVFRARGHEIEILRPEGDGFVTIEKRWHPNPLEALQSLISRRRMSSHEGLPRFVGGAVGWLSYDSVRWAERLPSTLPDELCLPDACFVFTDTVVIFDNVRGELKVVATALPDGDPQRAYEDCCRRVDAVLERLADARAGGLRRLAAVGPEPRFTPRTERGVYEANVERIRDYIRAGDAFQVVLSQRFDAPRAGLDPFDAYRLMRITNPSPYMFHLDFPEAIVTGASPECLVRKEGDRIEVRPIAGTRKRGRNLEEDLALELDLLQDEKERAEHTMLIDLARNDIGRLALPGSVTLDETMQIERYSHVMHLVSEVSGRLGARHTAAEAVNAVFPAGTLSGAPKIRAMEIIEELEPCRRGIYGGAVGHFSYTGNADLAIAIRTLVTRENTLHVQAGAGIVADSRPDAEHRECVSKALAVMQAVERARRPTPQAVENGTITEADRRRASTISPTGT